MREKYLLRWRYDYHDHKPPKIGQWNRHGDRSNDQAWAQNKTNLLRASIEAKNYYTKEITTVCECLGQDFVNFQWMGAAGTPLKPRGKVMVSPKILGLTLISRYKTTRCFINGEYQELPVAGDKAS